MINSSLKDGIRERFNEKYGKECFYCGKNLCDTNYTIDHLIPLALNGSDDFYNLRPCCKDCNTEKNSYTPGEWALRIDAKIQTAQERIKSRKAMSRLLKKIQRDFDKEHK